MSKTEQDGYRSVDVAKDFLGTVGMIAVFYLYWVAILLLISLFLVNVWHTSMIKILLLSGGLTIITTIVYLVFLIRRRIKQSRMRKYLKE